MPCHCVHTTRHTSPAALNFSPDLPGGKLLGFASYLSQVKRSGAPLIMTGPALPRRNRSRAQPRHR